MSFSLIEPEPVLLDRSDLREGAAVADPLNPRPTDVVQGQIAACPIAAGMVAMAHARPAALRAVLGAAAPDDVLSKRDSDEIFRHWSTFYFTVRFRTGSPLRVTPFVYAHDGQITYASTPNGAGWPSYIEKAYAVYRGRNSYNRLDKGTSLNPVPDGGRVMEDLAGRPDLAFMTTGRFFRSQGGDVELTATILADMLGRAERRPTIAGTITQGAEAHGVVSDHAYAVLRYRQGRVTLRNPWGGANAEVRITLAAFRQAFQAAWQSP